MVGSFFLEGNASVVRIAANGTRLRAALRHGRQSPLTLCHVRNTIPYMKTAAIHSRIEPKVKERAEAVLHRLGVKPTEAIRMFYTQIALRNALPFDVSIPNQETEGALLDSRLGRDLESFDSVDDLFDSWK